MSAHSELRKILKIVTFMKMTEQVAAMSYDPKHRVGSIIVKNDFSNVAAIGYNGNYRGGENRRDSEESGKSGFLHAEENALIKANLAHPVDYTQYVTMTPCVMCAKRMVNKGVSEVVYLRDYPNAGDVGVIFRNGGVKFSNLYQKLLPHYVLSPLLAPLQATVADLFAHAVSPEDMEVELYRLLCQQLAVYFDTRPFSLETVSFTGILTGGMDIHATIKAYAHRFLETVYTLS